MTLTRSRLIDRIVALATGARVAAAFAVFVIGGALLFRLSPYEALKARLDGDPLPEETITAPDRFADVLERLGDTGREAYLHFQLWDVLNPILIGVAGALLLGWLLTRTERVDSAWRLVVLLPIALVVADLLENAVIVSGLAAYPGRALIGGALPAITATKFGAAVSTVLSALALFALWLFGVFSTLLGRKA